MRPLIKLKQRSIALQAPRALVYQTLSALGRGLLPGGQGDSAQVIEQRDNVLLVEFRTQVGKRSYRTLEEVTLYPEERITFRHLEGPIRYVWEEFRFKDHPGGGSILRYDGEFSMNWYLFGWLLGLLYVRLLFERVIKEHLQQIQETVEARARRSHLFRASRPV